MRDDDGTVQLRTKDQARPDQNGKDGWRWFKVEWERACEEQDREMGSQSWWPVRRELMDCRGRYLSIYLDRWVGTLLCALYHST